MAVQDIVLDTSALIVYAEDDLQSLPVDELLDELRYDSGGRALIPWFALEDAQWVFRDDRAALDRLQGLIVEFGVQLADANIRRGVDALIAAGGITAGMAHAMLLAVQAECDVATFAASTLRSHGFTAINDLDSSFPPE